MVHYFDVTAEHSRLVVEAVSEVETRPNASRPPVPAVQPSELEASPERELNAE